MLSRLSLVTHVNFNQVLGGTNRVYYDHEYIIIATQSPEFKCTHIPSCTAHRSIPTIAYIDVGLFE